MSAPRRLALLVCVGALFVLLAVAARADPYTEQPPPAAQPTATSTGSIDEPPVTPPANTALQDQVRRDTRALASLTALQIISLIIVVIVVPLAGYVVLVVLGAVPRPRFRGRRSSPGTEGDPALVPRLGAEMADAVDHALDVVEHGEAREAIVACWLLLVRAASESGSPARVSETAREYAERLSAEQLVSTASLARLADLYREARFSDHDVGPQLRAEARRALGVLQTELHSGVRL